MKNKISLIVALVLASAFCSAQDSDSRENLKLGIKAGANLSNVYDTEGETFNADSRFGLTAGAYLSIPIGKYLGVQPELLFSQKGFQAEGTVLWSNYKFTRTLNYIDVPILVQFKPTSMFTLLFGPQYSYLIKQKDEFDNSLVSGVMEKEFENDNVRKNVLCFTGGFDINFDHFVFGARVGADVQNNNGDGTSANPRYKNVWYQATLGYSFY